MSYARRFSLETATAVAAATLMMIAVFLHVFLCQWGWTSARQPMQMTLLRIGPLGLFVRQSGHYPRVGILLVGVVLPIILVAWAVWLCWSCRTTLAAGRRRHTNAHDPYRPHEHVERLDASLVEAAPACVVRLGLKLPCTVADVRAAYRRQSKAAHPDRGGDSHAFISLRKSYEQAIEYVSRQRPRLEDEPVARIDPVRRHTAYRRPQPGRLGRIFRWGGVTACLLLIAAMGLGSRWTAIYRNQDTSNWFAIGAGAIELISLEDGLDGATRRWSIVRHDQPYVWWPIATRRTEARSIAIPLWILLVAVAAPTILLWRRTAR